MSTAVSCRRLVALGTLLIAIAMSLLGSTSSAWAISSDYCGYGINNGQHCFEGSGYRG